MERKGIGDNMELLPLAFALGVAATATDEKNKKDKEKKEVTTLLDVLKLIADDCFPVTEDKDGDFDTRPDTVYRVTICFMCEEETWLTCNIQNEILVPWYDCEVRSINPDDDNENSICVWLKDEAYLKKYFPQHIVKESEEE